MNLWLNDVNQSSDLKLTRISCSSVAIAQGTKLTFLARSREAPKFSKLVAKIKKLGAIKKKDS